MERPILHFPMVRIHDIAEEAREAGKTVSTQTVETDPSVSKRPPLLHLSSKKSQTLPSSWHRMEMTSSLKPPTHQQPRRISMASGSIRIPPEQDYGIYLLSTLLLSTIYNTAQCLKLIGLHCPKYRTNRIFAPIG